MAGWHRRRLAWALLLTDGKGCRVADGGAHGAGARWRVFVSHTSELRKFPRGQSY